MSITHELHRLSATAIFDLEDQYARERGIHGPHPRPVGPVKFCLVGRMVGGARQDFDVPRELIVRRNPSGYHLFFNVVRFPDGQTRQSALGDGVYVVRVESRFYQWSEREDIIFPERESPYFYDLAPGFAYPFPTENTHPGGGGPTLLRGSVRRADGRGVARTTVQVLGQSNVCFTDDTGQWVLVFPDTQPSGNVTVRFELPDGTVESVSNVPLVQGRETSLSQTTLRGWVQSTAGVGIAGATIGVSGFPDQSTTANDGSWFYYFDLNEPPAAATDLDLTVELPDGRSQARSTRIEQGATVVVPTIRFS